MTKAEVRIHYREDDPHKEFLMFAGSHTACIKWIHDAILFDTIACSRDLRKEKNCERWNNPYYSIYVVAVE